MRRTWKQVQTALPGLQVVTPLLPFPVESQWIKSHGIYVFRTIPDQMSCPQSQQQIKAVLRNSVVHTGANGLIQPITYWTFPFECFIGHLCLYLFQVDFFFSLKSTLFFFFYQWVELSPLKLSKPETWETFQPLAIPFVTKSCHISLLISIFFIPTASALDIQF